jgi:hypothetical protein
VLKKALKISAWVILIIFLSGIGFIYAIRTPVFQTWIVARVGDYLASEWNTRVEIERVEIEFFRTLSIKGLYVEDLHGDTLLYAGELNTVIQLFDPRDNKIFLSGVELNDATVKLQKYKGEKGINLNFIVDYFSAEQTDTVPTPHFDFDPGEIRLNRVEFVYRDNRYDDYFKGVDFEDIRVTGLNAVIDGLRFEEDTVWASVQHISFLEKSGFGLEYFETSAKITPVEMDFQDLLIKTDYSQIQGALTFRYDDFTDFDDFLEKVRIQSEFEESTLSSNDLVFFATELEGLNEEITFSGTIKGTVSQIRGRDLDIRFCDHSMFRGDISIAGLPDFEESFFDLVIDEMVTDKNEIESIREYPFNRDVFTDLPEELSRLGRVRFSGKFTGFLNDFVAYGNASTALGYVTSDINLKIDPKPEKSSYSGHLSASEFDIGVLTRNTSILGKVSFKTDVRGSGLTIDKVNAKMNGLVEFIDLYGYTYRNVRVDATMAKKLFNGSLAVSDENLGLEFKGTIDLTHSIPVFDFVTDIPYARLAKLKIIDRDTTALFATTASINLKGKGIDEMTGFIRLGRTAYTEINKSILIDSLHFTSMASGNFKNASVRSDLFDFDIQGSYRRTSIFRELEHLLAEYMPILKQTKRLPDDNLNMTFWAQLKNTSAVSDIFFPGFNVSEGTVLKGSLSNSNGNIDVELVSDSLRYGEFLLAGIHLNAENRNARLFVTNQVGQVGISDTIRIHNVRMTGNTDKTRSEILLSGADIDTTHSLFRIGTEMQYLPAGQVKLSILSAEMLAQRMTWEIDPANSILFDSTFIDFTNFGFSSGTQQVRLNGRASHSALDALVLTLKDFDASILNPVLSIYDVNIGGIASGEARCYGVLEKPLFNANLQVSNMRFFQDTLGNATLDAAYAPELKTVTVAALVDRGGTRNVEVNGKYYIRTKNDSLDFDIKLQKTALSTFSGYAEGLVSDIRGNATGSLKISGYANKPVLTGRVRLQQASFLVDYLNTRYSLADEVEFTPNYIRFRKIKVNDNNGNTAVVDGFIYHNHLTEFILNLEITAKNFQMLNTRSTQNEMYYGEAYGTGKVRILGPLDLIQMNLAIKTEKNTKVFIPLSNPDEVSKSSFINFVSSGDNAPVVIRQETKLKGIEMDFELDVTPDAEVQLIFDSKIGDVIKGRGTGNIIMNINTEGDFLMYGNYQVVSGDYLFTLKNIINKKFIITPGGTISWNGSPYEAKIDLEGVYKLKASLYDLMQDTTYSDRVPVHVHLFLKEDLFNPNISFDIKIPDIDPTTETYINRYISTEQAKSMQTMSLLVLNRFSPGDGVDYQGRSSSGVSANAAEILSQQLSVWASQISDVVNIGVNYRAADAFSEEELEVALSTKLFNDRVTLDGNVGVSDNNENTSGIIGDFQVEVKVSKDGKFRFKAFNKTINNSILNNYNSPYTQGIGIFYREDFNTFGELMRRFRDKFGKKEEEEGALITP